MRSRLPLRRARAAIVAAVLLTPAALRAQSTVGESLAPHLAPHLAPGARLRVDVRGSRAPSLVRLVRATSDTLWIRGWNADPAGSDGTFAVALASVRRLQLSRGRHTHVRRNAGYGLAGGLFVGGVLGAIEGANDDGDEFFEISPAEGALILGIVLGVPAGLVGALTGLPPTEDWTDVPLAASARVSSHARRTTHTAHTIRPRLGLTRIPVRGAPGARAITVGLTVRPR